jgi:hypothetical protein
VGDDHRPSGQTASERILMHFDLSISLGNVLTVIGVAVIWFRKERRMEHLIEKFLIEHELMVIDYCKRLGISVEDLPTRMKGLWR